MNHGLKVSPEIIPVTNPSVFNDNLTNTITSQYNKSRATEHKGKNHIHSARAISDETFSDEKKDICLKRRNCEPFLCDRPVVNRKYSEPVRNERTVHGDGAENRSQSNNNGTPFTKKKYTARSVLANSVAASVAGLAGTLIMNGDKISPAGKILTVTQKGAVMIANIADNHPDHPWLAQAANYTAMGITGFGLGLSALSACAEVQAGNPALAVTIGYKCAMDIGCQLSAHNVVHWASSWLPKAIGQYVEPWGHAGASVILSAGLPTFEATEKGNQQYSSPGFKTTVGPEATVTRIMNKGIVAIHAPEVVYDLAPAAAAQVATHTDNSLRLFANGVRVSVKNNQYCIAANKELSCFDEVWVWAEEQPIGQARIGNSGATGLFPGNPVTSDLLSGTQVNDPILSSTTTGQMTHATPKFSSEQWYEKLEAAREWYTAELDQANSGVPVPINTNDDISVITRYCQRETGGGVTITGKNTRKKNVCLHYQLFLADPESAQTPLVQQIDGQKVPTDTCLLIAQTINQALDDNIAVTLALVRQAFGDAEAGNIPDFTFAVQVIQDALDPAQLARELPPAGVLLVVNPIARSPRQQSAAMPVILFSMNVTSNQISIVIGTEGFEDIYYNAMEEQTINTGEADSGCRDDGSVNTGNTTKDCHTAAMESPSASEYLLSSSQAGETGVNTLLSWLQQKSDDLWHALPRDPLTLPGVAGEITSAPTSLNSDPRPGSSAAHQANLTELTNTRLHNPTSNFPVYDSADPNITVSEQAYSYSSLVLGLYQLRFNGFATNRHGDFHQAIYFAPVLSREAENTAEEIEYIPIALGAPPSVQTINGLAKSDPTNITKSETLAWNLGEIGYQPALPDLLRYPEFSLDNWPSGITINEFIDRFYHLLSGRYQLKKAALSYREVVAGERLENKPFTTEDLSPATSLDVRTANNTVISAETPPDINTVTSGYPLISSIIANNPTLLQSFNQHVAALIIYYSANERQYGVLSDSVRFLPWSRPGASQRRQFMAEYKNLGEQLKNNTTVAFPPSKELTPKKLTSEERNGYLAMLQPTDGEVLSLSDPILITMPCNGLWVLIPYSLKEALASGLSRYDVNLANLPDQLKEFHTLLFHKQWGEIMHQLWQRLASSGTSVEKFRKYSTMERRDRISTLEIPDNKRLRRYLDLLQSTPGAMPVRGNEVQMSDRVWVMTERDNVPVLVHFKMKEVLSGVLSIYPSKQLILSREMESHRDLITRPRLTDYLEQGWLTYCQADSIQRNQAPRALLRDCGHFEELWKNPFMLSAINRVVDNIVEYQPDLMAMVSGPLAETEGINIYSAEEIAQYLNTFTSGCWIGKSRQFNRPPLQTVVQKQRSPEERLSLAELQHFLSLLQIENEDSEASEPLDLSTRLWRRDIVDGLHVSTPYTLEEILRGAWSTLPIEDLLVPPELELALPVLVHAKPTEILYDCYRAGVAGAIREPIAECLSKVVFPLIVLEKTFQDLAEQAGVTNMNLTTPIGLFERDMVNPIHTYPGGEIRLKLEKLVYTPYDLLMNTGGVLFPDNIKAVYRKFEPDEELYNSQTKKLYESLITTDIMGTFQSETADAKTEKYRNTLTALLRKNLELYPPAFMVANEHQLRFGPLEKPVAHHPFITAGYDGNSRDRSGQPGASEEITLYSYLTGQQLTVTNVNEYQTSITNSSSVLYQWMIDNGGSPMSHYLENYQSNFIPFQMDGVFLGTQLLHASVGKLSFSYNEDIIENYSLSREAFLSDAPSRSLLSANVIMNFRHRSRNDMKAELAFDVVSRIIEPIGYVPFLGDGIDLLSVVIMHEVRIGMEDEPFVKEQLRQEAILDYTVVAAMSTIPYATMRSGKILLRVISASLGDKFKYGVKRLSSLAKGLKARGLDKIKMLDGKPNRPLIDANGNRQGSKVPENNKDFNNLCNLGGKSRRKRSPEIHCLNDAFNDKIFATENLKFVTGKEDGIIVPHFATDLTGGSVIVNSNHERTLRSYKRVMNVFFWNQETARDFTNEIEIELVRKKGTLTLDDVNKIRKKYPAIDRPNKDRYHVLVGFEHYRQRTIQGVRKNDIDNPCIGVHMSADTIISSHHQRRTSVRSTSTSTRMMMKEVRDSHQKFYNNVKEIREINDKLKTLDFLKEIQKSGGLEGENLAQFQHLNSKREIFNTQLKRLKGALIDPKSSRSSTVAKRPNPDSAGESETPRKRPRPLDTAELDTETNTPPIISRKINNEDYFAGYPEIKKGLKDQFDKYKKQLDTDISSRIKNKKALDSGIEEFENDIKKFKNEEPILFHSLRKDTKLLEDVRGARKKLGDYLKQCQDDLAKYKEKLTTYEEKETVDKKASASQGKAPEEPPVE